MFEGLFARARTGDNNAEATTQPASTRPTIGLALGGGAARGFAHIGVMRTLLAHGIVPDVTVGDGPLAAGEGRTVGFVTALGGADVTVVEPGDDAAVGALAFGGAVPAVADVGLEPLHEPPDCWLTSDFR